MSKDKEKWLPWSTKDAGLPCARCQEPMERPQRERAPDWFRGFWHTGWDYCALCRNTVFYEQIEQHQGSNGCSTKLAEISGALNLTA